MSNLTDPAARAGAGATGAPVSPLLYSQLGHITRQLHDALDQLGVMPALERAALDLPDARSRLDYIATKFGQAAEKVLNLVEEAKAERHAAVDAVRGLVDASPHADAAARGAQIEALLQRIDARLTDIMLAQDFHDLTGQVMRRVAQLATEMEASLVTLLLQAAPGDDTLERRDALQGPVVVPHPRNDVATSQREVDELLASLGF